MKIKSIIIVGSILGIVIVISCFVHFVSGVSATYPPIKQYEYSGSFKQLIANIRNYTSIDSNLRFEITDTVGTVENGYATYVSIEIQSNQGYIEYSIKCEENNSKESPKTIISLVKAYNRTRNTGGYGKEAKGIDPLVNNFKASFLIPLRKSQNIIITTL